MSKSQTDSRAAYTGHVPILWRPFHQFAELQSASGLLLIFSTMAALVWANSPWFETYESFWHTHLDIRVGTFELGLTLVHWINDGLMAVFFLLVGLEIKRELLAGELAEPRKALLPIVAALGGMLVPAGFFLAFNLGGPHAKGWGIPMATDIAFALGVLSLLGTRVPASLKVFLAALAIIDDIGAVLVIAFFYTKEIDWQALGWACAVVAGLAGFALAGVRRPIPYLLLGVLLWLAFVKSGVHASISGVVLAFLIPHRSALDEKTFSTVIAKILSSFGGAQPASHGSILDDSRIGAIHSMEQACQDVEPCLQRLERLLHPWVSFLILPIFALANAGIHFDGTLLGGMGSGLGLGIVAGLLLGKPIGILSFSSIAVRSGLAGKPSGATAFQMLGVGILGGIGFTMSIFIAGLAFENGNTLALAKLGILGASLLAGILGYLLLRLAARIQAAKEKMSGSA